MEGIFLTFIGYWSVVTPNALLLSRSLGPMVGKDGGVWR